jgi:hypothetical protein
MAAEEQIMTDEPAKAAERVIRRYLQAHQFPDIRINEMAELAVAAAYPELVARIAELEARRPRFFDRGAAT